jgi:hypothetical protein
MRLARPERKKQERIRGEMFIVSPGFCGSGEEYFYKEDRNEQSRWLLHDNIRLMYVKLRDS